MRPADCARLEERYPDTYEPTAVLRASAPAGQAGRNQALVRSPRSPGRGGRGAVTVPHTSCACFEWSEGPTTPERAVDRDHDAKRSPRVESSPPIPISEPDLTWLGAHLANRELLVRQLASALDRQCPDRLGP